jgi:uncharacterized protein YozE (UPF0346 family)
MSKYAQALGIIEISVKSIDFKIKPTKGDNLRFSEMRKAAGKDQTKLTKDFITYFADLIAREEKIEKDSEEYKELEVFIEFNVDEIQEKVLVSFGWVTEEELRKAEEKALEGFQKQLNT